MTDMIFSNLPATRIHQLPDCAIRAVLLAALAVEDTAHTQIGWDKTVPMIFQFLQVATRDRATAAIGVPICIMDEGTMTAKARWLADAVVHNQALRDQVTRPPGRYLGTGLINEAWISPARLLSRAQEEARLVIGRLADGTRFVVRRSKGREPLVDLSASPTMVLAGPETGIDESLGRLNRAFGVIRGDQPAAARRDR